MSHPTPATFKTAADFREHLQSIAPELDCDESEGGSEPLARPLDLGFATCGNRFAVQPMEGWDGTVDGGPGPHTLRRWRRFGESGAKLVWGGEAFAVREDGRANSNQLFHRDSRSAESGLRSLLDVLRESHVTKFGADGDLVVGLQLTHSGRFARAQDGSPRPRIAFRHPLLDPRVGIAPDGGNGDGDAAVLTDLELESIADAYVVAAATAQRAGFQFVDVKCCHGYLLHELLAAKTRPGRYGGSLRNRTALLRRIVEEIHDACPGLGIGVRLSASDVVPFVRGADGKGRAAEATAPYLFGFGIDEDDPAEPDLREPARLIAMLRGLGVRLFNVTLGSPYYCPHLQRPAAYPPSDGYASPDDPLRFVATHLRVTRHLKLAFRDCVFVGSGYSYLQEYLPHVARHEVGNGFVDSIGIGRMALSYPELAADVIANRALDRKKLCRTFSDCTTAPRNGLVSGCYPLDPYYRALPEAAAVKEIKARMRAT